MKLGNLIAVATSVSSIVLFLMYMERTAESERLKTKLDTYHVAAKIWSNDPFCTKMYHTLDNFVNTRDLYTCRQARFNLYNLGGDNYNP